MGTERTIGLLASVFTALSLLPQLVKTYREKKPAGISPIMLLALFLGLALWIWYGILKDDTIIIVSNAVSMALNILVAMFSFYYMQKAKRQGKQPMH